MSAGWPPGTQFERDALAAGEAVIVTHPDDPSLAVGLVPEFGYDESDDELVIPELCALSWTVYSLPGAPVIDHIDLGEAEYTLRSAVRSAADCPDHHRAGVGRRRRRRSARAGRAVAGIHTAPPGSRARAVARLTGAGERGTRRRDHHGQRRTFPNRHAVVVRDPDRHRRAAATGSGRAVGENGCAQRDSARRVAELTRSELGDTVRRTARLAVDARRAAGHRIRPDHPRGRTAAT